MKKYFVVLLALVLAFSFVGCTQYDYSLLYWQMQQQQENQNNQSAQTEQDIENANIPALFNATFNPTGENTGKVEVTYSTTRPDGISLMSSNARADVTEIYATAVYTDFSVGGNGTVSGTLYYVFEVNASGTNYAVVGYTAYQPEGTSLELNIGGHSYELEIEVTSTEASGTITENEGVLVGTVNLTAPSDSDLVISSEPVQTPVDGELTNEQMINDMLSQLLATQLLNALISSSEMPQYTGTEVIGVNITSDVKDGSNNTFGTVTYVFPEGTENGDYAHIVSWSTKDQGLINLDGIVVSWTGSISGTYGESGGQQTISVVYDNFKMSANNAPLPPGFEFSSINATSTGTIDSEGYPQLGPMTVEYNNRPYTNEELARSALLMMLPMSMSGVSYPEGENSGNLADLAETGLSVPFTSGTWTRTADGGIDIEGAISYLGYNYMVELSLGNSVDGVRSIESFMFGSSQPLEEIDVTPFNFIMDPSNN